MKIVKSIRLSEDNIQEIMDCPVVYRISKLEFEPKGEIADANLCTQLKPTILVYVQGYKEPCKANGVNHLFVMEDGNWRCLPKEVMERLGKDSPAHIQRLSPELEKELDNALWKTVDDVLNSDFITHLCNHSREFVKIRDKFLSLHSCNKTP